METTAVRTAGESQEATEMEAATLAVVPEDSQVAMAEPVAEEAVVMVVAVQDLLPLVQPMRR